jgi:hypothetical protein
MADFSEDIAERATDLQQLAITNPSEILSTNCMRLFRH